MIRKKTFPIPEKFHTLVKFEAIKSGKTITSYMEDVANEMEEMNVTFRSYLKGKKDEKKKFVPRF